MQEYDALVPNFHALDEIKNAAPGDVTLSVAGSELTTTVTIRCDGRLIAEIFWTRGSSRCTVLTDRAWVKRVIPPLEAYKFFDAW